MLYFFCDPCFHATVQKFRLLYFCYTVTCNSPGHNIKRPGKYLFSIKFISSLSINSCYHSNDKGCSDTEGLANRMGRGFC